MVENSSVLILHVIFSRMANFNSEGTQPLCYPSKSVCGFSFQNELLLDLQNLCYKDNAALIVRKLLSVPKQLSPNFQAVFRGETKDRPG